ncbi:MAG: penicillin-binding protein 2 [Bacteroidota bacterium]|nr:penicillin-binding protein 2 [Bacteroidota bacterium]
MVTEEFGSSKRRTIITLVVWLGFIVVVGRLYQLQYIYSAEYGKKSEENSIRKIVEEPVRGYVYDRNDKLIVDNRPSYSVMLTPIDFNKKNLPFLSQILGLPEEAILEKIKRARQYNPFMPARIKRDIDFRTLSILEEYKEQLPGVKIQTESKRYYASPASASHLLGYVKEISDYQLERLGDYYQQGDVVGSVGIEAKYEKYLRGQKGYEFISQNARGQMIGTFNNGKDDIPPHDGLDLHLAVDAGVQALAESLMTDRCGAVVAVDPNNGGVIAMVSAPEYNLSDFSGVTPPELWKALNDDDSKPLFNRATLTRYPPGSTFKMVLAIAALENHVVNENYRIVCRGSFKFGNKVFRDEHVHGSVNIIEAIQKSCNVFFYQLMLKVGLDPWAAVGKEFGFGELSDIDILEENPGLLPTTDYFNRVYGKGKWTQGYLVSLGIGQGEIGVTPLQMADYCAMLANKGHHYQPHIVDYIYNNRTHKTETVAYKKDSIHVSERTWDIVREGMRRCVMSPGGTGWEARIPGIEVAGKTGTAQNPHGKAHAWFIGFAPFDHPKIAICVLVENAGYGGSFAAPIAGLCMEKYLYGEIIQPQPARNTPVSLKDTAITPRVTLVQKAVQPGSSIQTQKIVKTSPESLRH